MANPDSLTIERLRELLTYDPDTGVFKRLVSVSSRARAGAIAGCLDVHGYVLIGIDGNLYKSHRLAWLYMFGEWPKAYLDHRDRNKGNNRIENLREATPLENSQNIVKKNNPHGFMGVSFNKRQGKWWAQIQVNGEKHYLGCFHSPEEASNAYISAKERLHPFANI